ncbi:aspartate racemase [Leifsonia sp. 98AMF]|uniref:aspartate/glutamate racemase family protein n=1 Tax=unclassified Leifsonia TaxID=2663824 RepID=UPI000879FB95|nr:MULTISPECIES: aspartate/glutamate racemase family protein [unclassified Leifsonia]SDG99545.1 aspartate racemase [Leifsonia sp. 197AMF]SDJ41889.1 aspartate racemase [Leifsonia sp. 466MF]SDK35129.1 aspartate racemase [Leifsonia sp. 157MF]SDN62379.1 aspartate racemase [Leifsonia sp. 509MF]SEN46669.1 aspartate racemase [Leifsonia sp. 467MF]
MKRIGLLGGMSWESSALYYQAINEGVRERLGGLHSADLVMISVDFADIERLQSSGDWERAGDILAEEAIRLERVGASCVVICTNTMHKVADRVQAAVGIPLLHLADVTAAAVIDAGVHRVALLGTRFTMREPFYRERLESTGLEVIVPPEETQAILDGIIYDELVLGVVTEASRAVYREAIAGLIASGAEGVILGCTEIELLVRREDSAVPTFPTTALHAAAAVDFALG